MNSSMRSSLFQHVRKCRGKSLRNGSKPIRLQQFVLFWIARSTEFSSPAAERLLELATATTRVPTRPNFLLPLCRPVLTVALRKHTPGKFQTPRSWRFLTGWISCSQGIACPLTKVSTSVLLCSRPRVRESLHRHEGCRV